MDNLLKIFRALSDKNRIRILKILGKKPLCVCEINAILGLAVSTTSQHLSILKDAQLIFEQKERKWVNYHMNRATQNPYVKEMLPLIQKWIEEDEIIQKDLEKIGKTDRKKLCER